MEKKSTSKKTKTTAKKKPSASTGTKKRKSKKSKGLSPAYKILVMCLGVIAACMLILLITLVVPMDGASEFFKQTEIEAPVISRPAVKKEKKVVQESKPQNSITQRFEKSDDSNNTSSSVKKDNSEQIAEIAKSQKKKTSESKKTEAAKTENTKAAETKQSSASRSTSTATKPAETAKPIVTETKPAPASAPAKTNTTTSAKTNTPAVENTSAATKPVVTENKKNTEPVKQNPPVTLDLNKPSANVKPAAPAQTGSKYNFPQAVNNAQLVFIFDDGGQNLSHLEKFLELPFPITIAVLPRLANSKASAAKVRASGNELMLHQPMQPLKGGVNPGPGAITSEMTEDQIISTLFQNVTEIGPIAGFNNHEGSAITADAEKMALVMRFASENSIYFLDSRTNVETTVPYVASEMGYSYYERNIFLDNEKTRDNVLKELNKGLTLANKNGVVIMIGHVWSADFLPELLKEIYPELKAKGYTFTVVSKSKGLKY
ncbi:MAG: divergent polysaccharide deacetylase family protein [Treponema sp.]|nr:divergent polysaccharide deacetylase family protein [Treponema sp.]